MAILVHALFTTDAAPLRQALLDAGIGKDMTASLENQVAQPSLTVEVTNAEATDADRFHQVMEETLTKLVRDGIDRTLLEASLNWMEFKMREADFGTTPKGLIYNMAVMTNWLYGEEPTEPLFYEENLQKLRAGLDNGYFEDLARRCLMENPHQVLVTMAPSRTMAAAREAALAMAAPERPENMDEDSPEGAVATGSYFVQLYPYVYATGDLEQWRAMTRQDCLFCGSVITNVTSLHDSGGWVDPWVHTITETGYSDPGPGSEYSRVDIVFSQEAAYTYDGTGAPPKVSDPVSRTQLILAMRYEDGHWIIRGGQVE